MRPIDFNKLIFWAPMIILLAFFAFAIIRLTIASPAVPNPGHSYTEIEFPPGIVFTPAGQLGIGTNTPNNYKLNVIGNINASWVNATGGIIFPDGSTQTTAGGSGGGLAIFGDGSDEDAVISSNYNLPRDMFYSSLTVNSGVTLNTNGYRIFVKGTLTNNGIIARNGVAGGNGGNAVVDTRGGGGTAGTVLAAGSLGGAPVGGAGGYGGSSGVPNAQTGGSGTATNPSLGGNSGAGGAGVNGDLGTGGAAGASASATPPTAAETGYRAVPWAISLRLLSAVTQIGGGASGGGGGGGGYQNGQGGAGGGGGAGSGGGVVVVVAKNIVNAGDIAANGGAGGNGGLGYAGTARAGSGGGGGGGGVIILVYNSYSGAGTKTVNGGAFGAAGTGPVAGNPGVAGSAGTLIEIPNA